MQISPQEIETVQKLKQEKKLISLQSDALNQKNGLILVTCADGDQFHDLYHHLSTLSKQYRDEHFPSPRIHVLGLNGGALVIPSQSPLNKELAQDKIMRNNIKIARALKKIDTIALFVHTPCGAAHMTNLKLEDSVRFLLKAKEIILQDNPGSTVVPLLHVDYGNGKKRTYELAS